MHRAIERRERARAVRLCLIHRGVRIAHDFVRDITVGLCQRDADRRRDLDAIGAQFERHLDHFDDSRGNAFGNLRGWHVGDHEDEFVAAVAHHRVFGLHRRLQPIGDRLHQTVADLVTVRVVDRLETGEVHEQHRDAARTAPLFGEHAGKALTEETAIRQTGQAVVHTQARQLSLGPHPLPVTKRGVATGGERRDEQQGDQSVEVARVQRFGEVEEPVHESEGDRERTDDDRGRHDPGEISTGLALDRDELRDSRSRGASFLGGDAGPFGFDVRAARGDAGTVERARGRLRRFGARLVVAVAHGCRPRRRVSPLHRNTSASLESDPVARPGQ